MCWQGTRILPSELDEFRRCISRNVALLQVNRRLAFVTGLGLPRARASKPADGAGAASEDAKTDVSAAPASAGSAASAGASGLESKGDSKGDSKFSQTSALRDTFGASPLLDMQLVRLIFAFSAFENQPQAGDISQKSSRPIRSGPAKVDAGADAGAGAASAAAAELQALSLDADEEAGAAGEEADGKQGAGAGAGAGADSDDDDSDSSGEERGGGGGGDDGDKGKAPRKKMSRQRAFKLDQAIAVAFPEDFEE